MASTAAAAAAAPPPTEGQMSGTAATTTTGTAATTAGGNTVGFKPKTAHGGATGPDNSAVSIAGGGAAIAPERVKALAALLAKLPDLDLGETARVKSCLAAVLGEGRENIVSGLELRVVLGELGVFPSEAELLLVLRANRERVNLVSLTQYLRLYKKECWVNRAAAVAAAANGGSGGAGQLASPSGLSNTYRAFSGNRAAGAAAAAAWRGGGGGGDEDTLKAFIALGGDEDGGGEVAASALRDAIRGFGLTIDIDSMIRAVDVHHSGMLDYIDFCALWTRPSEPNDAPGGIGLSMGEALLRESADAAAAADDHHHHRRRSSLGSPLGDTHQRLLSVLATTPRRTSLAAGALRRRSQMLAAQAHELGTSSSPQQRGSTPGGTRSPQATNSRGTTAAHGQRGAHHSGNLIAGAAAASALAHKSTVTLPPTPITDDEHMLLVQMYLFPEQFESTARRAPRFASGGGGGGGGGGGVSGGAGGDSMPFSTAQHQHRLSRMSVNGSGSRGRSQGHAHGTRKGRHGADAHHHHQHHSSSAVDGANALASDFFAPKNQNVYRPPSPLILSMRNSTAHRNRLKRLEEQSRARKDGASSSTTHLQRSSHAGAATVSAARGEGSGGDGDNVSTTAAPKAATW
ncbi:hypothetical protein NESM_000403200 [Novymonas esmeraldas]|uniref:EF-hand domain-containing protein n=1 Tax=Novymonas esmeraldas TaxID=1808958 RepID=A0AAW0EMR3_9TRYP